MRQAPIRKQKVELSDYNYHRDITNRLLMAHLTAFEVEVLTEVLNASLKFRLAELVELLDSDETLVIPVLDKLSKTGLLSLKDKQVIVDKEMRKYYEAQIVKFDDDFEPGMEFLQGLLSKVPIHHLPSWYAISRISDHIFQSIVEKYLITSRTFERYLQELEFEDPLLLKIMRDVYSAPDFKILSKTLTHKHGLSHEEFERKMLVLEYSFICCISYERVEDHWEEVVTPFHEWREYLRFLQNTYPKTIKNNDAIERFHPSDFGFVDDLTALLEVLPLEAIVYDEAIEVKYQLSKAAVKRFLPHVTQSNLSDTYARRLISKGMLLGIIEISNSHFTITEWGKEWLQLCKQDQAHKIYCLPFFAEEGTALFADRDMRELEKSLKLMAKAGWIEFDAFVAHLTAQIGKTEQVTLKNKGKRWRYALPSYTPEEKKLIETLICGRFFDCGMLAIGYYEEKLCFCVTPFGRLLLES